VMESGRVIASRPEGWTGAERLRLPLVGRRVLAAVGRVRVRGAARPRGRVPGAPARDARPRARAGRDRPAPARREPAAVIGGRTLPLRRRQAEILALLCLRPDG
jgi:hypothetical protein